LENDLSPREMSNLRRHEVTASLRGRFAEQGSDAAWTAVYAGEIANRKFLVFPPKSLEQTRICPKSRIVFLKNAMP
jgi:hypothetical protein